MEGRSKPTLADVARVAGVTPMTVSRLLTGAANVKESTAIRVHKAIEMLRYQPNETARALRTQHSRMIGVLLPSFTEPFVGDYVTAIGQVARRHGYSVILGTTQGDRDIEYEQAQVMLKRSVEGIVVIPGQGSRSRLFRGILDTKVHMVGLGRPLEDPTCDAFLAQEQQGAKAAVEHLIGHGLDEIVFLSETSGGYLTQQRLEGYREAMEEAGLRSEVFQQGHSIDDLKNFLLNKVKALGEKRAGIVIADERAVHQLFASTLGSDIEVPKHIVLVSLVDFSLSDVLPPGITVVRQPHEELGKLAADMLFEQIERGDFTSRGAVISLPIDLVVRQSCGCLG